MKERLEHSRAQDTAFPAFEPRRERQRSIAPGGQETVSGAQRYSPQAECVQIARTEHLGFMSFFTAMLSRDDAYSPHRDCPIIVIMYMHVANCLFYLIASCQNVSYCSQRYLLRYTELISPLAPDEPRTVAQKAQWSISSAFMRPHDVLAHFHSLSFASAGAAARLAAMG